MLKNEYVCNHKTTTRNKTMDTPTVTFTPILIEGVRHFIDKHNNIYNCDFQYVEKEIGSRKEKYVLLGKKTKKKKT